jgi:D-amino-acid dehydrogenase
MVLGAGVIGTTSAYYLSKCGHEVEVVDRRSGLALETSFANAGGICPTSSAGASRRSMSKGSASIAEDG